MIKKTETASPSPFLREKKGKHKLALVRVTVLRTLLGASYEFIFIKINKRQAIECVAFERFCGNFIQTKNKETAQAISLFLVRVTGLEPARR
jgi:hypothetical protein